MVITCGAPGLECSDAVIITYISRIKPLDQLSLIFNTKSSINVEYSVPEGGIKKGLKVKNILHFSTFLTSVLGFKNIKLEQVEPAA